jgi:hypothetical protein
MRPGRLPVREVVGPEEALVVHEIDRLEGSLIALNVAQPMVAL